jgi:CRISPR-associated endonuclease/helicase Cas3
MHGPAGGAVAAFQELTKRPPHKWQERLLCRWFVEGRIPDAVDIPTGLGKTAAMALWLAALSVGINLPRRLVYVVDRRTVVDQASEEADRLAAALGEADGDNSLINELRRGLGLKSRQPLPVSTLRGQHLDNRLWLEDPAAPAIIIGTVDMIGSRLLFEGYGVSPRMRPVHAGLIGADALLMLDEAHLVPPFASLLRSVAKMRAPPPVPRFHLMTLSATGREQGCATGKDSNDFALEPEDWDDPPVRARLDAEKRLLLRDVSSGADLADLLAARAFEMGAGEKRVVVFCNSRGVAQKVCHLLAKKIGKDGSPPELLVGARRVHEREKLRCSPVFRRFDPKQSPEGDAAHPAFLVATSAGEVGVDLDADHMVCDLVPWERMVQRLGRVNRRPDPCRHVALIDVFAAKPEKDAEDGAEDGDKPALWRKPFDSGAWPKGEDGRLDASPGMLHRLKADLELKTFLENAISEEPPRPALTKPLLEAWSMTSLAEHPGRPEVEPWLRGWVKEEPQTRIVWRRLLPVRRGDYEASRREAVKKTLQGFFEHAPPHLSEVLETLTREVTDIVQTRARAASSTRSEEPSEAGPIAAVVLSPRGDVEGVLFLEQLARIPSNVMLAGRTILVDSRLGGLDEAGLLAAKADKLPPTLDQEDGAWEASLVEGAGFRVRKISAAVKPDDDWRIEWRWPLDPEDDGEHGEEIRVEVLRRAAATSGDAAIAKRAQELAEHHEWAAHQATVIADGVGLREPYRKMLIAAAATHDAGKARDLWQRAMGAPRDGKIYAKTVGGGIPALLNGYRHEFGSLRGEQKDDCLRDLPEEVRELALHLIASHHGFARPVIAAIDPEAPPSACAELAREAALRFARLQAEWGVWGLAWWEALLRAADWAASRALNEGGEKA